MKQAPERSERGRAHPAVQERTVRISPRFPASTATMLAKASALRGLTVTGFVLEAARSAAERVIAEESRWQLDETETRTLFKLLARPPKLNAAARRATACRRCYDSLLNCWMRHRTEGRLRPGWDSSICI